MKYNIKSFSDSWRYLQNNTYEIMIGGCLFLLFCLIVWRFLTGQKGTYTKPSQFGGFKKWFMPQRRKHMNNTIIPSSSRFSNPSAPVIMESRGEQECRRVLQEIFQRPFHKARPDFLRNPITGGKNNLELDCFNPELRLAVEYSGRQHYVYTPHFHSSRDAFYNQKYRDDLKRRLCKQHGIYLIEVPYNVQIKQIEAYLRHHLYLIGLLPPPHVE